MGFEGWSMTDLIAYSDIKTQEMKQHLKAYLEAKKNRDITDEEIKKLIS